MTDHLKFDPEGLLPPEGDDTPRDEYVLMVSGLTPAQYRGLVDALRPAGQSLSSKIALRVISFAVTMVVVSGLLWTVAAIVTNIPGR